MSSSSKCPCTFQRMAESQTLTTIPIIFVFITSILLIILSALQAYAINNDDGAGWCQSGFDLLHPFHFKIEGADPVGCPWRIRNTIFRSLVTSTALIASIAAIIVLYAKPNQKMWVALWWTYWLLFVFMFIVFILDCDGINNGFSFCLDEYTEIIESLNNEMEACYITPWVWTAIVDLILSVLCYMVYAISKYYIVDDQQRRMSVQNRKTSTQKGGASADVDMTDNTNMNTNTNKDTNKGKKKGDSPDPFQEYQGSYDVNRAYDE